MQRKNQPEQRQSSIFIISILAGTILGVVLLGLIAAFFVTDTPINKYSFSIPKSTSHQEFNLKSTYFVDHFVNYGGETARIPNHYCKAFYNFAAECPPTIKYLEVSVADYNLPIDKITSAATDFNKYIVYTVVDEEKQDCAQKAFVVDLASKTTKELNIPDEVFVCGAIGTYVESLSPGGRFVRFEATGPASAYGSWLYDLQNNELDEITKHGIYHSYLDTGSPDERDRYVIFEGGCDELDILTMGADCGVESVFIKDNFTGNSQELNDVLTNKDYSTCFANYPIINLDGDNNALVISSNDCLGVDDIIIKGADEIFESLKAEKVSKNVRPKIEQYTDEKAYGIIKKLYQKNGAWYVDIDIAEFFGNNEYLEACKEDGKNETECFLVYVRNNSDEIVTFQLSSNVKINLTQIIKDSKVVGVGGLHKANLEDLKIATQIGEFHFIIENGIIIEIVEQFFS